MFVELARLLDSRAVTLTVSKLSGGKLRVNVVPQKFELGRIEGSFDKSIKDDVAALEKAAPALSTPLSITGTPEELDAELPQALTEYVEEMTTVASNLAEAKEALAEAYKVTQAAKQNKTVAKTAKATEAKKPEPAPVEPKKPVAVPTHFSLFGAAEAANQAVAPPSDSTDDVPECPIDLDETPADLPGEVS